MSVIGFDIGNESCVIAASKRGGIDLLLNDESKRGTPSVVSFGEKQRFLGSAGAASATANPKSTISQVKRLIGRVYADQSVKEDLKLLPFVTSEGPRGGIMIELEYLKQKMKFTPVEILGMLFTHLKQIAEKNLDSKVVDCVIGIPSYFTDLQRREYLDAARIAGLKPLSLMHDCTATALAYGMYKTDNLEGRPLHVIFVDIGHCDTQVTVAHFIEGQMKILSHSFDHNLGGRDFDEVLFKHFAAEFKEKYKIDVYSSARASIRLRASCEKVKKVLSANVEASLSIDSLIDDRDVKGSITREKFEKLSSELLKRVTEPCLNAIKECGLSTDNISAIELVGSGSRIPAIMKKLTSFFHKEPTRTLNASECVAKGCALRCAMLSLTQKVRPYKIYEMFPYSIALSSTAPEDKHPREYEVFAKRSQFPIDKMITRSRKDSSFFKVMYSNKTAVPSGISPIVGHFAIKSAETPAKEVDFKFKLNHHGIFEIELATLVHNQTNKFLGHFSYKAEKKVVVDNVEFYELDAATIKDELLKAREREVKLANQDKKVEQSKNQRNTLESFVYDTRSKLSSAYQRIVTETEKKKITNGLQETEDWLYEDSDDEHEENYNEKLEYLKELLEPIETRYKEEKAKAEVTKDMQTRIEKYQEVAKSLPPYPNKAELLKECKKTQEWLDHLDDQQPILLIKEAIEKFERRCKVIIGSKPSVNNHDKPMHLHQWDQPKESDQSYQPADWIESAEYVVQRDQPKESDQRHQLPVKSPQWEQTVGRIESDHYMDQSYRPVHPNHWNQLHMVSNQWNIPREGSYQMNQDVDLGQRNMHMASNQWNIPREGSYQMSQDVDLGQRNTYMASNQWNIPHEGSYQMNQDVDLGQRNRYMASNQRNIPREGSYQMNQEVDLGQRNMHIASNQTNIPLEGSYQMNPNVDLGQRNMHIASNQTNIPLEGSYQMNPNVDLGQRNMHIAPNQTNIPLEGSYQMNPNVDLGQRNMYTASNQTNIPHEGSYQMNPNVELGQKNMYMASNQTNIPHEGSYQMNPNVDLGQRKMYMASNQTNVPHEGSYQMNQDADLGQQDAMEVDKSCEFL